MISTPDTVEKAVRGDDPELEKELFPDMVSENIESTVEIALGTALGILSVYGANILGQLAGNILYSAGRSAVQAANRERSQIQVEFQDAIADELGKDREFTSKLKELHDLVEEVEDIKGMRGPEFREIRAKRKQVAKELQELIRGKSKEIFSKLDPDLRKRAGKYGDDFDYTSAWKQGVSSARNSRLSEVKTMSKRDKLEEMVLEYCQTKNFKTLSEVKKVRSIVEKILQENKEEDNDKADIDDDGKISGWEKARSDAIQKNMDKDKEDTNEGVMDKIKSKFKKKEDTRTDRQKNADDMTKAMVGIGEGDDVANLYESPITEAELEEEIDIEEGMGCGCQQGPCQKCSMMEEDKDPCWKDYEMVGMKTKNGREVPNCVPKKNVNEEEVDEVMTMDSGEDQTGRSYAMAKKEAGRMYSKDGKAAALKGYDSLEEEEEQIQEKTKDTGPKSRDRDEPDRHHKPKGRMNESKVPAKKSAQQVQESKFDKKFHDLVKKWCK